jgi:hypothetical protein
MKGRLVIPSLTVKNLLNFWKKVNKCGENNCWVWTGGCNKKGYGIFAVKRKTFFATRVMLAIIGKQNTNLEVCHKCNNSNCVNPKHIYFGTHVENEADKILAGTTNRGCRHGMAKLKEADIPIIRKLNETLTQLQSSRLFGVHRSQIGRIISAKTWRHIKGIASTKEVEAFYGRRGTNVSDPKIIIRSKNYK